MGEATPLACGVAKYLRIPLVILIAKAAQVRSLVIHHHSRGPRLDHYASNLCNRSFVRPILFTIRAWKQNRVDFRVNFGPSNRNNPTVDFSRLDSSSLVTMDKPVDVCLEEQLPRI